MESELYWFMLLALAVVVIAVALVVLGPGGALPEAEPDRLAYPLPLDRPVNRVDIDTLRLPMAVRGYRMSDVDDVLDRVAAELSLRDQRIAELESVLAGNAPGAQAGLRAGAPYGPAAPPPAGPAAVSPAAPAPGPGPRDEERDGGPFTPQAPPQGLQEPRWPQKSQKPQGDQHPQGDQDGGDRR